MNHWAATTGGRGGRTTIDRETAIRIAQQYLDDLPRNLHPPDEADLEPRVFEGAALEMPYG